MLDWSWTVEFWCVCTPVLDLHGVSGLQYAGLWGGLSRHTPSQIARVPFSGVGDKHLLFDYTQSAGVLGEGEVLKQA